MAFVEEEFSQKELKVLIKYSCRRKIHNKFITVQDKDREISHCIFKVH